MAPLRFPELSLDVKKSILYFIDRPTDLKNLCLTSKQLREIVTPQLYRCIHLFVGGNQDMRLLHFISSSNPGLKHIREIYLRLEKVPSSDKQRPFNPDDSSDEDDAEVDTAVPGKHAQFTLGLLLSILPPNILEIFSWQCWEPLNVTNFEMLCKNHHGSLRVVDIGPMDRSLHPVMVANPKIFTGMSELHSIDMYPDTVDRLKACQKLLEDHPKVENLCVSNSFGHALEIPEDLHDSSTQPGLLTRTLFSHKIPFERCKPLQLKNLDLDTIELRYAADTWVRFIKFSNLARLEIRNCSGADALFSQLSKPQHIPSRLTSLRWMDDQNTDQHALEAFEGFLGACSELLTLHVNLSRTRGLPKVNSIVRHKKTLESLSVHTQNASSHAVNMYSQNDVEMLCTQCTALRQLSLMFPKLPADSHPSLILEFANYLGYVKKLHNLITLNIRRWPTAHGASIGDASNRLTPAYKVYEHNLQRIAQYIFESSDADAREHGHGLGHRSRLSVVCWGGNGETRVSEGSDKLKLKQVPFVRGKKVDPFGHESMLAVQTIWRLVQYIEQESDILNHALYDMHEVNATL